MPNAGRVLVVEDNETERRALLQILKADGFLVFGAENADKAMGYADESIDVVLSDLHMGDVSGIDLLQLWKKQHPETQFILVTGERAPANIVEAMKNGAYDYVTKPINLEELSLLIRRAIEVNQKDRELDNLRRRLDQKFGLDQIVGESRQMKEVFARIQRAAPVDSTVLILGESGTGKELVAQALHHNSLRKKGPFVAVNCAAVPATLVESELFGHVRGAFTGATDRRMGRFEQADGGTLFIDEIGDFELGLQAKLLRVLETLTVTPVGGHEDRKVDVRVLAATNKVPEEAVARGELRNDLYYRLNVFNIHMPALREHREDVPDLVHSLLSEMSSKHGRRVATVSEAVLNAFKNYTWPGNVRELRNTLERAVIVCEGPVIETKHLPPGFGHTQVRPSLDDADSIRVGVGTTVGEAERLLILKTLESTNNNKTRAAEILGISLKTLHNKLKEYGSSGPDAKPGEREESEELKES